MKNIINKLGNIPFKYKVTISMILITAFSLSIIFNFLYYYFLNNNIETALVKAEESSNITSDMLKDEFKNIFSNASIFISDPKFVNISEDIENNDTSNYYSDFINVAPDFEQFIASNPLISNAFLIGETGVIYSDFSIGMDVGLYENFQELLFNTDQITFLPSSDNYFQLGEYYSPIVLPISIENKILIFKDSDNSPKIRLVILLNNKKMEDIFDTYGTNYTYKIYLTNNDGTVLNLDTNRYPELYDDKIAEYISSADTKETIEYNDLYITIKSIDLSNLKVIHTIKKSSILDDYKVVKYLYIVVLIISILLVTVLTLFLCNFLMKPLDSLISIIKEINEGSYKNKKNFKYKDELGLLGNQLNNMNDTIQDQIQVIKEDEANKLASEMQMLSEQITPHFLYNTLECIHFQILNSKNATASSMIESLGKYLRITLSVGQTFIPIDKEIEHVYEYIKLMNRHVNNKINFTYHLDSELKNIKILKMILQPLVENSIKYGFSNSFIVENFITPEIDISIIKDDDIIICVKDNGIGMNIDLANQCLENNIVDGQKHFGLNNLQKRLQMNYGKNTKISFESIPYLSTCVIITIKDTKS